jgi:hypothetical protein
MVRVYAAYRIHDKSYVQRFLPVLTHIDINSIYDMTLLTYLIAFGHFTSELLIYRTTKINPGTISTLSVACEFCLFNPNPSIIIERVSPLPLRKSNVKSNLPDMDVSPVRVLCPAINDSAFCCFLLS